MSSNFHVFDANDALSEVTTATLMSYECSVPLTSHPQDLASTLEKLSAEAISQRGKFTMAISGGSLPKVVARCTHAPHLVSCSQLAAPGLVASAGKIEFGKWHVFFADERYQH